LLAEDDAVQARKHATGGQIETLTFVHEEFNGLPPYAFGYVLPDGADTAVGGFFRGRRPCRPGLLPHIA